MISMEIIIMVGSIVLIFLGIPWIFWGVVTKFTFYRERTVDDKFIYTESYEFMGGWKTLRMKTPPKAMREAINKFRDNPLNKYVSKQIEENDSWSMGTPFPQEVIEEYEIWKTH